MKKMLCIPLILALVSSLMLGVSFASQGAFSDVPEKGWAAPYITDLYDKGYISGYPDGSFKPESPVRIDEFIAMTMRALGHTLAPTDKGWAAPYVEKAMALGVIEKEMFYYEKYRGYRQDLDDYTKNITREQMASVIVRAIALSEQRPGDELDLFVRGDIYDFAQIDPHFIEDVYDSYKMGIVTGTPEKMFMPQGTATRAQAAAVITKVYNKGFRKPFVKREGAYCEIPSGGIRFNENVKFTIPIFAPVHNGQELIEIVDIAKIMDKAHEQGISEGKGYTYWGGVKAGFGSTGYQTKAFYDGIYDDPDPREQSFLFAERMDFAFSLQLDDLSSKYRPYDMSVWKKQHYDKSVYKTYSEFYLDRYGHVIKPIFDYLFEAEAEKAWKLFVTALDYNGEVKRIQTTINGRYFDMVYDFKGVSPVISLKH